MKRLIDYIPQSMRIPLLVTLIVHLSTYPLAKLIAGRLYHYNLETPWDLAIPFLPWTVVIYVGSYFFWVICFLVCAHSDEKRAYRLLSADLIAKLVGFLIFILLPTTNTRPDPGSGFWNFCIRLIYLVDTPDNLFPSVHCLQSWFCWLGIRNEPGISKFWKACTLIFALAVFVSTLTTKQHILIDVVGGCLLAEITYRIAAKPAVVNAYCRLLRRTPPQ